MNIFRERADIRWARLQREARNQAGPATELVRDLQSLIDALDRCAPRLVQVGEADMARQMVSLCARAATLVDQMDATARPTQLLKK